MVRVIGGGPGERKLTVRAEARPFLSPSRPGIFCLDAMTPAHPGTEAQRDRPHVVPGLRQTDIIPLRFGESDVATPAFIREAAKRAQRVGVAFHNYARGNAANGSYARICFAQDTERLSESFHAWRELRNHDASFQLYITRTPRVYTRM